MISNFFDAQEMCVKLKVTVQRTGRLGFTAATATALQLSEGSAILIAPDDTNQEKLYMVITTADDKRAFPLACVSGYYSAPTRGLFDRLGVDYINYNNMYDLVREPEMDEHVGGLTVYGMTHRPKARKQGDNEEGDE